MSSSTMVLQPDSPSADFINEIEPDYEYALEDFEPEEPFAEMIFDWDDTLLPSSWLSQQGLRLEYPVELPNKVVEAMLPHDQAVCNVLKKAMTYGNVVIITNAERGWVELSAARFMPITCQLLSEVNVISARTKYEPEYPDDPLNWKINAFRAEIDQTQWNNDFDGGIVPEKNIISFGDSCHERDAIQRVGKWLPNCFVKSVKFVERPTLDQLRREVGLLDNCLDYICTCRSNLDLMLTIELLYD